MSNRLRELRDGKGLSQEQLAEMVGTRKQQISKLENSERKLSAEWMERLAPYLDCAPYELYWRVFDEAPLISWVQAGTLTETVDPYVAGDPNTPRAATTSLPHEAFIALTVRGDSMNLIAPEGSIIFVDLHQKEPLPNRYYVIRDNDESTFKKYQADPVPLFVPHSSNPDHPGIQPGPGHEIVGRVIRVVTDLE